MREARAELAAAGFGSPAMDTRRILEAATGTEPAEIDRVLREFATVRTATSFQTMLKRRLEGEPLQYVVGAWGFRNLDLMVDQRVLIPRPETEVVTGRAIAIVEELTRQRRCAAVDEGGAFLGVVAGASVVTEPAAAPPNRGGNIGVADDQVVVVDLGTGSGAIALSVAQECPSARVYATDISTEALSVARANLAGLGRAAARITLHEGDWFAALPGALRGAVDVVISNPPYIATSEELPAVIADWEPPVALWSGPEGDEATQVVISGAYEWLRPEGFLVLETASQRAQRCSALALDTGFRDVRVDRDLAGLERVVVGRRP